MPWWIYCGLAAFVAGTGYFVWFLYRRLFPGPQKLNNQLRAEMSAHEAYLGRKYPSLRLQLILDRLAVERSFSYQLRSLAAAIAIMGALLAFLMWLAVTQSQ
jgi:hypothetical protein